MNTNDYKTYLDYKDVLDYKENCRRTNRGLTLVNGLGDTIVGLYVSPQGRASTEPFAITDIDLSVDITGTLNIWYHNRWSKECAPSDYMRNVGEPSGLSCKYDIGDVVWCGQRLTDGSLKKVPCIIDYIKVDEGGIHYSLIHHGVYGWSGTCFSVLEQNLRDTEEEVTDFTPAEGYFGRNGFYGG